jgi:hypothetical protein
MAKIQKTVAVDDKAVKVLEKEITPVVAKAAKVEITSAVELTKATEVLSQLNKYSDAVTARKETVTKPLNAALKAAKALFFPLEEKLDTAIDGIRSEMSRYQTEQVRIKREEEAAIARRVGEGRGKISLETASRKLDEIEKPVENVSTDSGSLAFREVQKLKVVDETVIPREYLAIDEKKLLDALKGGQTVKGAEIELIQVPINRR